MQQVLQVLEPKFKLRKTESLEDYYINITNEISSPVTLFMSKSDFEDKDAKAVHLFSYSIGKERVVTWSAYLRDEKRVVFDGGCKFNTYSFIEYQNDWKRRNFVPISAQFLDRTNNRLFKFLGARNIINTKEDYKALLLYRAWFEEKLTNKEFVDLLGAIDQRKLLYSYDRNSLSVKYEIENILTAFFDVIFNTQYDFTIHDDIWSYSERIYKIVDDKLKRYEETLNTSQIIGEYKNSKEALLIADAFEKAISKSKFTRDDVMQLLEECPKTGDECWGEYRDEKSSCAIYTYGETSFNERDDRHPDMDLR